MEHIQDDRIRNYVAPATCADQRTSLNIFSSALADLLKFVDAEMEQLLTGYSEELSAEKFINQPTIVYVICPDENPTRHFLASLFIRLFSNELIEFAEQPSNGGVLSCMNSNVMEAFGNLLKTFVSMLSYRHISGEIWIFLLHPKQCKKRGYDTVSYP